MQTDAHMTFAQNWDSISIDMLNKAPSRKPVLSHYPPSHEANLEKMDKKPGEYWLHSRSEHKFSHPSLIFFALQGLGCVARCLQTAILKRRLFVSLKRDID